MKSTQRLEAFSDGVLAIIITIMVLEMDIPHGTDIASLHPLLPVFLSYILSFIYVGIYWNNHHHLFHFTEKITGGILWANLNLLFWLSLFPFATAWMGENSFAPIPTVVYGGVLLMAALAWWILQRLLVAEQGSDSLLTKAVGGSLKEKISPVLYILAIFLAFIQVWIAHVLYVLVAFIWIVPDRRIEKLNSQQNKKNKDRA